jgi:hypothetical protein
MAEVHDCFTPTELVLMEDLGFAERGKGWKEVLAGTFDLDGELPVNPDGGLKSFGHPIGASGLRMLFECWLQLRKEAPTSARSRASPRLGKTLGLTHNLGGAARRVRELHLHRRVRADSPGGRRLGGSAGWAAVMGGLLDGSGTTAWMLPCWSRMVRVRWSSSSRIQSRSCTTWWCREHKGSKLSRSVAPPSS